MKTTPSHFKFFKMATIEKCLRVEATDLQDLNLHQGGAKTKEFDISAQYPEREYVRTEKVPTGRFYPKNGSYAYERRWYYLVKDDTTA